MALLGAQFVNAVSPNPVGSLQAYAGPDAPTGWLLCDGSSYSTSAYPELYDAIGYTYGGSAGTFYVPDMRGRVPMGAGTGAQQGGSGSGVISGGTALTARSLGQFGGDERMQVHTHTQNAHTHTQNAHGHGVESPGGHTWGAYFGGLSGQAVFAFSPAAIWSGIYGGSVLTATNTTATNQNTTATNQNTGSGQSENMPPFVVTNYIIKAQSDAPRSGLAYGSTPPIVTQLPSNPQFGDVVTYIADATNGVAWSLQYEGSGSYPWKFIGGAPLYSASTGAFTTTSTTWTLWSTSPNITIPLAGDYINEVAASTGQQTNAVNSQYCTIGINGSGQSTNNGVWSTSSGQWDGSTGMNVTRLTFAASDNLRFYCREDYGSQTAAFDKGRLTVTPVRVAA